MGIKSILAISLIAVLLIGVISFDNTFAQKDPKPPKEPKPPKTFESECAKKLEKKKLNFEGVLCQALLGQKETTEDTNSKVDELLLLLSEQNDVINTIRGTVQESYIFELEIGDTVGGALQFILVGTCAPEAEPCSLMSVKKIITPDAGILPVYVLLCTDVLVCNILHGEDEISVGIAGGIAFGIGALADVEIDLEEPLISPIPINLLHASGLGEVSFSNVLVLTNLPGYEGTVKFIGEKPLDVTLTGAYIDGLGALHCFNADGDSVSCDDVADALTGDEDICFDTDLFPVPAIDDAIEAILAFSEEEGFDLSPPEKATVCEICLDGSLKCDLDEIPFFTKSSPLQTCTMPAFGEEPECTDFEIDVESLVDDSISDVIIEINETVGEIDTTVGSIEDTVDDLFNCVTGQVMDTPTDQTNNKCFLTNIVADGRQVIINVQEGVHDLCHEAFSGDGAFCHDLHG